MSKIIDWKKVRNDFPVTRNLAFFQSAGMSPIPNQVYETIKEKYYKLNQYGDISWDEEFNDIRQFLSNTGKMINSSGDNLTLLPNTSFAFSLIALSLKNAFGKDFNIVTLYDEFPASNVPFAGQDIDVKYVKPTVDNRFEIDDIMAAVDNKTKAIVASYVNYSTGFRIDIETLSKKAKEKGLLFVVNATQGFPIFALDVKKMNIDVLAASLHKWGCAGHVGSLFYTSPGYRKKFPSPFTGWLSVLPPEYDFIPVQKDSKFQPFETARQYEYGTVNQQVILGSKTAFEYMNKIGFENIRERIFEITDYLVEKLSTLPVEIKTPLSNKEERTGIISIDVPGHNNQDIAAYLKENKVFVAIRNQNIRLAVNFFNNRDDVDRAIDVLCEYLGEKV